jgi:hypothetical protein
VLKEAIRAPRGAIKRGGLSLFVLLCKAIYIYKRKTKKSPEGRIRGLKKEAGGGDLGLERHVCRRR